MFKKSLLISLLFSHFALAETRFLDEEMHFSDDQQKASYKIDLQKDDAGWKYVLTRTNGDRVLSGHLVDLKAEKLFAPANLNGENASYNGSLKTVRHYEKGKAKGPIYEYAYFEYAGEYSERLQRIFHYAAGSEVIDDKIIDKDGGYTIFIRDKNDKAVKVESYDKNKTLLSVGYDKTINGVEYDITEEYGPDKKIAKVTKKYHLKKDGAIWGYTEQYDAHEHLISQTVNDYQHEPASEITYGPNKNVLKRHVYSHDTRANLKEVFDEKGTLIARENIDENGQKQGLQIFRNDNKVYSDHYKNDELDGTSTVTLNSHIVKFSTYKQGEGVGKAYSAEFKVDEESQETDQIEFVRFYEYGEQSAWLRPYTVDADFIAWNSDGKPALKQAVKAAAAPAFNAGEMSVYSYGDPEKVISLPANSKDKTLHFPLSPGDAWKDNQDMPVTVKGPQPWQYHYHGESESKVIALTKIAVATGEYDALVIQRLTKWTKSKPTSSGMSLTCQTPECAVSGYTQTFYWYAPEAGRIVLKAVEQTEDPRYLSGSPDDILKANHAIVFELVHAGSEKAEGALPAAKYAHLSDAADWGTAGHVFRPNNTWEFMMAKDVSAATRLP